MAERLAGVRSTDRDQGQVDVPFAGHTTLVVGDREHRWLQTKDFPITDPWSGFTRKVIDRYRREGAFSGNLFEAGVGDGRNIAAAGMNEVVGQNGHKIIGVDVDARRLTLARENLVGGLRIPEGKVALYEGDVVGFLQGLSEGQKLTGWGVACLPQAPMGETVTVADGFDPGADSLQGMGEMKLGKHTVDTYGLTLNAGFLTALRERAQEDYFSLLLTMSDRVPHGVRRELYEKTGWRLVEENVTIEPIQQDPDTGIAFVQQFDDGYRFFEDTERGIGSTRFEPISAAEAERRRAVSNADGGRGSLNVYHHLTVARVVPMTDVFHATR